jgi:hypothetical protein
MLIVDERHFQRVLDEDLAYFNAWRPQQGLGQRAPCGSASTGPSNPTDRIIGQPVLGGLHHAYPIRAGDPPCPCGVSVTNSIYLSHLDFPHRPVLLIP